MAIHTLPYEHPVASLATLVDDPSASAVLGPDKPEQAHHEASQPGPSSRHRRWFATDA